MRINLIFSRIISFICYLLCVLLSHLYFFRRISDSQFRSCIHDFEEELTEPIGPVPFPAEYLICRYVLTDGQTDGRIIRVGLGNLSVPPG